jgi:hypothetical protein
MAEGKVDWSKDFPRMMTSVSVLKGRLHKQNLTCCSKSAKKLSSHCLLSQVVNKYGTTQLLTVVKTLLILSDLLQGCSNKSDTVMV